MTTRRDAEAPQVIRFGPFTLDLRRNRLLRGSTDLRLRAKTWAVLCYLAERRGCVVSRDQLLQDVWPDVVVTEETLTKSITEIRRAVSDDPRAPRFLHTVHGRGFRFLDVAESGENGQPVLEPRAAGPQMVGREKEIAVLSRAWEEARAGQRRLVFVTGEPGIGKTTLVDAFLRIAPSQADPEPAWIARGCCVQQHGTQEPYLAVFDALDGLLRPSAAAPLRALLQRRAPTWMTNLPWLRDELATARPLAAEDISPRRMLREFGAFIEAAAAEQPLLLLLEDLHWSDPSTVDLLAMLAQRRDPARLLIIGTYRPAEAIVENHPFAAVQQTLRARSQSSEIALEGLDVAGVCAYLHQHCPGADSEELATLIHAHTDGAPLFVVATVDHLIRCGCLVETEPGWAVSMPLSQIELAVPDDLRMLIRSQLQALRPREQLLLEAASVAGIEFGAREVAAGLRSSAEVVETQCERLARSNRFLRVAGSVSWPDGSSSRCYAFRHALHRQVVYDDVPDAQRRGYHQRIGVALEQAHTERDGAIAGRLAHHFRCAGDAPRAIQHLAAAAASANQRCAPREAIAHLESALALLAHLPDPRDRRRQELALRLQLGPSLNAAHGYGSQEVRDNYDAALALCDADTPAEQRYAVLYALWYSHLIRAERDESQRAARELVTEAARLGAAEQWLAQSVLGRTAFYAGEFAVARAHLEPLCANGSARLRDDHALFGPAPRVVVLGHLAETLWTLGFPDQARSMCDEVLELGERSDSPFTLAVALFHCAYLFHLRREPDQCKGLTDRLAAVASEYGFVHWDAAAAGLSGWVLLQTGDPAAALPRIESALAIMHATGARISKGNVLAFLVEALGRLGRFDAALAAADEGLAMTEANLDAMYGPKLWRVRGEALALRARRRRRSTDARDDLQAAEQCMRRSLELARSFGSPAFELRAALSLAELLASQGAAAEGRALVGPIYSGFTEGRDTEDLLWAAKLMAGA